MKFSSLWDCIQYFLAPTVVGLLTTLSIYIGVLSVIIGGNLFLTGIKIEGLGHELNTFVDEYQSTPFWWLTSLIASATAVTIGSNPGILVDILVLSIFVLPALYYFNHRYPFSLDCFHEDDSGVHRLDQDNIVRINDDGEYLVRLNIQTGAAVDDFRLRLEVPNGVTIRNIDPLPGVSLIDGNLIDGEASPGKDMMTVDLYLEPSGTVRPGRNTLVIRDDASGRILEQVRILPPN